MLHCCSFSFTCTHMSCYAAVRSQALAHIRPATLLCVIMHLHTYIMLRCCAFGCTCTHTSCYAPVLSRALPQMHHATLLCVLMHLHIRHATLLCVVMRFHTYVMLRCCALSCACTHKLCYAAVHSRAFPMRTFCYSAVRALAHIRHATLRRCCAFSCACTHTSCYYAVR